MLRGFKTTPLVLLDLYNWQVNATWPFSLLANFWIFIHSVKKVSKPRIFCEVICASKRTLVILIKILYCTAFFKAKIFVILFFLSFVWFISGEGISLGVIFPGANFLGGKTLGGNFHYNPAHKMVEKFGKSSVLSICLSRIVTLLTNGIVVHSFTCGRSRRSFIIVCLIVTKYFCH